MSIFRARLPVNQLVVHLVRTFFRSSSLYSERFEPSNTACVYFVELYLRGGGNYVFLKVYFASSLRQSDKFLCKVVVFQ